MGRDSQPQNWRKPSPVGRRRTKVSPETKLLREWLRGAGFERPSYFRVDRSGELLRAVRSCGIVVATCPVTAVDRISQLVRQVTRLYPVQRSRPPATKEVRELREKIEASAPLLPPPGIITKEQLRFAGDTLMRNAEKMKERGAHREDHYAQNQLAHWLWRIAER